jgi:hypothetical protein
MSLHLKFVGRRVELGLPGKPWSQALLPDTLTAGAVKRKPCVLHLVNLHFCKTLATLVVASFNSKPKPATNPGFYYSTDTGASSTLAALEVFLDDC